MATGAGKTYTAITSVYRLLKFAKAKRILFLVDTRNLGKQAEQEFRAYKPNDDKRLFPELYTIQRLQSNFIDPSAQVCISTIQRMYSILKGSTLDESLEDEPLDNFFEKMTSFQKMSSLTYEMIKKLNDALISPPYLLSVEQIWRAYERTEPKRVKHRTTVGMLTDIISLIRFELKLDETLEPYSDVVNRKFKE